MTTLVRADAPTEPAGRARASLRAHALAPLLVIGLAASVALAVSLGSVTIPLGDVWAILLNRALPEGLRHWAFEPWWSSAREAIVVDSRLPRALMAAVVGAALAIAGTVAQAVTRNPLADPYLLGVSSGAGFGVVVVTVLGIGAGALGAFTIPVAAFLGALLPLCACVLVSVRAHDVTAIILVGVAMSMVFSALITFFLLVVADRGELSTVMHWLAGGFGDAKWSMLAYPTVVLVLVGGAAMLSGRWLNLLHAGDDGAAALGMNVRRFRILILVGVSLLAAAAAAVSGAIGFIGLLIPHLAGYLVGRNAIRQIPIAALCGALALVLADIAARSISSSTVLPVGVVTAMIGGPVFIAMLWRQYGRAR